MTGPIIYKCFLSAQTRTPVSTLKGGNTVTPPLRGASTPRILMIPLPLVQNGRRDRWTDDP